MNLLPPIQYSIIVHAVAIAMLGICNTISLAEELHSANTQQAEVKKMIRKLYPYEAFETYFERFENRERILNRRNYETFLNIKVQEYVRHFKTSEIKEIVDFLRSTAGKKWIRTHNKWDFLQKYMSEIGQDDQKSSATIWTCKDHTNIQVLEHGICPICDSELVIDDATGNNPD